MSWGSSHLNIEAQQEGVVFTKFVTTSVEGRGLGRAVQMFVYYLWFAHDPFHVWLVGTCVHACTFLACDDRHEPGMFVIRFGFEELRPDQVSVSYRGWVAWDISPASSSSPPLPPLEIC